MGLAQALFYHLKHYSSNVSNVEYIHYLDELRVGDIIQWNIASDNDHIINHSTLVTAFGYNMIYLTYHSPNRVNVPITQFLNEGDIPFAWGINH